MDRTRILPFEGIHNFRDYGGYRTKSGGRVKRDALLRSGQHMDATDADLARLDALNIAHVIDLRGNGERRSYPCRRPDGFDAQVIFYDGETAALAPHVEAAGNAGGALDTGAAHAKMEKLYADLPFRAPLISVLKDYFAALAKGEGVSVVHCLAGKDRTGMAVALMHHVLGVHRDDAMEDFLLTNTAGDIEARIAAGGAAIRAKWGDLSDETIRVLMGVDERYLAAFYDGVEGEHGSLENFLRDVLDVDDRRADALRLHLVAG